MTQSQIDRDFEMSELKREVADLKLKMDKLMNGGMDNFTEFGYVQWDGIAMRFDSDGMQVATGENTSEGIFFVNRLVADPDALTTRYGVIKAAIPADQSSTASLLLQIPSDPGAPTVQLQGSATSSFVTLSANSPAGTSSVVVGSIDGSPDELYVEMTGALRLSGLISPTQIVANQDDYNPTDLASATVLRLSTDASRDITGIVSDGARRMLLIFNVGSFNIVLKDDVTSTAANRFQLNGDITLQPNNSVGLWYDTTDSRWRAF